MLCFPFSPEFTFRGMPFLISPLGMVFAAQSVKIALLPLIITILLVGAQLVDHPLDAAAQVAELAAHGDVLLENLLRKQKASEM